jgi:hypothetical protein
MIKRLLNRRVLGGVALAVVIGTMATAGVSFAQDTGPTRPSAVGAPPARSGLLPGIPGALENLVARGVISQPQADAVQREANTGTIDPKALVQEGVLSDAQMHLVAARLDQLKAADR